MYSASSRLRTAVSTRLLRNWQPVKACLSRPDGFEENRNGDLRSFGNQKPKAISKKKIERLSDSVVKKMTKKKRKPRASPAGIVSNPANQETYKDLVFKWMLEAYPESLSRIEIAGKLRAHPQRVKALIVTPLCKEGRIFKWGQKTAPYERYMPNVKAPEYYEVTGEKPPTMPSVNEQEFLKRVHPGLFGDHMQKKKSSKKGKDPPGMIKDEASQQQQQEESSLGEETVKAQRSWADLFDIDEVEDEAADDDDDELEATEFLEDDEEDLSDDELDEYEDEGDGELSAEEGDEEDKDTAQARIKGQRFQGQNGARVQDAASKR